MFFDKQILVPKEEFKILNYENIIDLIKYLKRRYLFNHLRINCETTSKRFKKTKRLKISARNTLVNKIDISIVKSIIDKNPLCRFSAALVYREFKEKKPNFKCSYSGRISHTSKLHIRRKFFLFSEICSEFFFPLPKK